MQEDRKGRNAGRAAEQQAGVRGPCSFPREISMASSPYAACIEACNACALACDRCAAACLEEDDPKPMARCIALDIDCAALCRLAAGFMGRDSEFAPSV